MKIASYLLFASALPLLCGCAKIEQGYVKPPLVYRVDIQQGNFLDSDMLLQLQPGMKKSDVRTVLGTPLLIDPFHNNRWDYFYSRQEGNQSVRDQRHVILNFENDRLQSVEGDIKSALVDKAAPSILGEKTSIEVPIKPYDIYSLWGAFDRLED